MTVDLIVGFVTRVVVRAFARPTTGKMSQVDRLSEPLQIR